jgi:ferredoxin
MIERGKNMFKVEIIDKEGVPTSFLYDSKKSLLESFRLQRLIRTSIKTTAEIPYACKVGGCGVCKIKIHQGEYELGTYSTKVLPNAELSENITLACKTYLKSDSKIEIL